jgi:NAD(P)H-flavin reductase
MKFANIFAASLLVSSAQAFVPSITQSRAARPIQKAEFIQYVPTVGNNHVSIQNQRDPSSRLFMGWGPEPEWSPASILSVNTASSSGKFVTVSVEVPASVLEEYKVPGQYVQVKQNTDDASAKPLFLAIASPPVAAAGDLEGKEQEGLTSSSIEFLVKKTENNEWITNAPEGTAISISQVMGKGFPIEEECEGFKYDFPLQNCLMFANGSGIAPIRAAIESGQLKIGKPGKGGRTARLYFGCSTVADMPYISKFNDWEANGVEVVPVISQPENCQGQWNGRTGYVQSCLEEDGVPIPRNTGALLCGVKGMTESVKDLLTKAGVFEGRVMTNF